MTITKIIVNMSSFNVAPSNVLIVDVHHSCRPRLTRAPSLFSTAISRPSEITPPTELLARILLLLDSPTTPRRFFERKQQVSQKTLSVLLPSLMVFQPPPASLPCTANFTTSISSVSESNKTNSPVSLNFGSMTILHFCPR